MDCFCNFIFINLKPDVTEAVEENFGNIPFYGNKVLQLKQEKDTAWYKAYLEICKSFKEFMSENAL